MKNEGAVLKESRSVTPTLLGHRSARIPTAGKIRAGIKVLSRRAQESAQAREIYEQGVAEGRSFDDIKRQKGELPKQIKLSARASGWIRCEIEEWVKARMAAP